MPIACSSFLHYTQDDTKHVLVTASGKAAKTPATTQTVFRSCSGLLRTILNEIASVR